MTGAAISASADAGEKLAARLEVKLKTAADGQVTRVDIIGLRPDELDALRSLSQKQLAAVMEVYVDGVPGNVPQILGSRTVDGTVLEFTPRFPLNRGMRLRAVVHHPTVEGRVSLAYETLSFQTPAANATPPTSIEAIYPSSDRLPENLLRFYIHFSGPMRRGEAYRHIHLLNSQGETMDAVFLELGEELWDQSMQRFTLLCDPARVKRGLLPREELGSVLRAGQDYTLVIDPSWPDANGTTLTKGKKKVFHVLSAEEAPLDPKTWKLDLPPATSRAPVVIHFPKPLDHSLLMRLLHVTEATGERIAGSTQISDQETSWEFRPDNPWQAQAYQVIVDTVLEDVAGNSLRQAFDVDVDRKASKPNEAATIAIPFSVAAP